MGLVHEVITFTPGYKIGDQKIAHYDITFTANQLVEPAQDPGWFLLNGAVVSQTTYPILYALFGTAYNTGGEGTGNFRLPNYAEGRTLIAKGLTNFTTRGASGGEINHTLTTAELYSHIHGHNLAWSTSGNHGHSASGTLTTDFAHTHSWTNAIPNTGIVHNNYNSGTTSAAATANTTTGSTGASANHFHSGSLTVNAATQSVSVTGGVLSYGDSGGHNNMQPYIVVGGWLVRYR